MIENMLDDLVYSVLFGFSFIVVSKFVKWMIQKDIEHLEQRNETLFELFFDMADMRRPSIYNYKIDECQICYYEKMVFHELKCKHEICRECSEKWFDISLLCPFCREKQL